MNHHIPPGGQLAAMQPDNLANATANPVAHHRAAHGADSLHAIQMAIEGAKAAIEAAGVVCSWGDSEPGDIGIPRSGPDIK